MPLQQKRGPAVNFGPQANAKASKLKQTQAERCARQFLMQYSSELQQAPRMVVENAIVQKDKESNGQKERLREEAVIANKKMLTERAVGGSAVGAKTSGGAGDGRNERG